MDWVSTVLHSPVFWISVIPLAFICLLFTTALFERNLTTPYIPATATHAPSRGVLDYAHETPDPSMLPDYVALMSAGASDAGFVYGGLYTHADVPKVKLLTTFWMSPSGDTFVQSGAGTVIGMKAYQTWIFTLLADGSCLVTTDNNDGGDYSGLFRTRRLLNATFEKLYEFHRERVARSHSRPTAFPQQNPMEARHALNTRRVQLMMDRGFVRFRDGAGVYWSHTAKGALMVCLYFFVQLGAALPQIYRVNRKPIASPALKSK